LGGRVWDAKHWVKKRGGGLYLFLEIATIIIPSTPIAIAGATELLDSIVHTAKAMQSKPTISLSFLTYTPTPLMLFIT